MIKRLKINKMKDFRLFALLALLLMSGRVTLKAQDYVSILQEGNEWNTLYVVSAGLFIDAYSNYVNWCSGDTLIDGVQYTKLMGTKDGENPHLFTLLREEDGKVWMRLNNQTERLLYGFNANVGDTLRIGYGEEELIVDSISIEQIGGVDRKMYWFGLEYDYIGEPYATETWIEGIGSNLGLLYSGTAHYVGGYSVALCFHQNGDLIWQNPEYGYCTYEVVEDNKDSEISIYPNPVKDIVVIEGVEAFEVHVFNSLGQLIKETKENILDLSDQEAGTYIIKVITPSGTITKQIIKK